MGAAIVIMRDPKDVAINDVSFWADTLPLLSGFHRVIDDYMVEMNRPIAVTDLDRDSGGALHAATLQMLADDASGLTEKYLRDREVDFEVIDMLEEFRFGTTIGGRRVPPRLPALSPFDDLDRRLGRSLLNLITLDHDFFADGIHFGLSIGHPVPGCGFVASGHCDILTNARLVELKLTQSAVGIRDVRQVLVYVGLLHLAGELTVSRGSIANPRLGIIADLGIEEVLLLTGGLTVDGFADRLGQFLQTVPQSR